MHSNDNTELLKQISADSGIKESTYPIGEVAKMIGSKVRTIRYYDEIGLVKPTSHTEGGHRLYTTEDTRDGCQPFLALLCRYHLNYSKWLQQRRDGGVHSILL